MTTEATARQTFGGVSPIPHRGAIRGVETVTDLQALAAAAGTFPNFTYHGGPVVSCALVYTSFWGDAWLTDPAHLQRAGRLSQFMKDLLASRYMNVLSQYGAGAGAGAAGLFLGASFLRNVPADLTDAGIHGIIQSCIDAGVLPEPGSPSGTCLMVFLAEGIAVNDPPLGIVMCEPQGDTAFGYHNFFTTTAGHSFYYAMIPGLDDSCLTASCSSDTGCSLHLAEAQEQRQTQVTSHEFAEMVTDPELNAWFDPNPLVGENGDICNGQADIITVGPNTWTVQRTYSKTDDIATNGATICLTEAPNPIPKLTPGPSGLSQAVALQALRPGSFDRLLPTPNRQFDVKTKKASVVDKKELRRYVASLFAPLQHQQLVPDLPGLLRQAADTLESKKGRG